MRAHENWIEAFMHHQRYTESPDSFHFWTAVSTLAGALRRRVWINQLHFQWTPNMYIILVGPPGVAAKSTSIRNGLNLLEGVPGISFGPQSLTWQALIESFAQATEVLELPGAPKALNMSCLTIGISELGTFFDPSNKEFGDLLTAMWDGQKETLRRRTVGRGETVIYNPWLNIIGCTTPSWLTDRFPDVMIGGGLTSRIVFVYGDKKKQLIAYPSEQLRDEEYVKEEQLLLHDLIQISQLAGEYKLTPAAISFGTKWYASHNNGGLPAHLRSGRYDGYLARKQTHIHKLAIILAAAKRDELVIEEEDLREAETYISSIEPDMIKVFNSIGVSDGAKVANEVLALVRNHKEISYKELWKLCFTTHDQKSFSESLKAAKDAGYVRYEGDTTNP